jgi:DEAD/DEAH box helicase domain-containing protein
MPTADQILEKWARHPERGLPFVSRHHEPVRAADLGPFPEGVAPALIEALRGRGVESLYSHQSLAVAAVLRGENVVVATPTASGKTLVYNLPVLTALLAEPSARALYLFPTKALAHDQVAEFDALAKAAGVGVASHAYDGDTPADARRAVRDGGRVVITNPDMLHAGILPHHDRWQGFFTGLRYVVIDEVHTYRGVFGSHVANVLRRLKRVAAHHGAKPVFILCSATIANPQAHAEKLLEAPVSAVTESGAPRGARTFYLYNPPIVDGARGIRGSYVQAARKITAALAKAEVPTIVFANSRLNVERLTRHLKEDIAEQGGDPESVSGYRGGYLPEYRRAIEKGLRDGRIRTVVSTSALELGIDIGQLEACVLAGYPGSIASALQRAGRAGRRQGGATIVMVTRSEPADQYIAQNPAFLFGRSPEHARVEPNNLLIVADHIKCAAFELPFEADEAFGEFGAEETREILEYMADQRVVHRGVRRWQWTGGPYPANGIGLRSLAEGNFTVIDRAHQNVIVGEVDYHSAASTLYPQAIYIVGGETWQVMHLDWTGRRAEVLPVQVDYFTDAMTYGGVRILDRFDEVQTPRAALGHGEVRVFEKVVGFKKIRFTTGENVGYGEVNLPENELHTTAFWVRPLPALTRALGVPRHRLIDALEGLGEALKAVATVHLMCDGSDLGFALVGVEDAPRIEESDSVEPVGRQAGGVSTSPEDLPTLYIYERYPGGVGFHDALYEAAPALLKRLAMLLDNCHCEDGCPACVGAPAPIQHTADRMRSRKLARNVLTAILADLPEPVIDDVPA